MTKINLLIWIIFVKLDLIDLKYINSASENVCIVDLYSEFEAESRKSYLLYVNMGVILLWYILDLDLS
ncbi:hypothetical protein XSR1_230011 [Xenorhabdus szentirmaii DSM 16338]|uniref:Uncharacterized protein n=1 Tax=Xenorhabdus szentirmaii DSM 16338 TaxID=1427518 RepID=W1IW19_9GAMM|nr:hypothetical protein XSR1_230011 [Xenorhabdus szentirmaii DSM 16338]